MGFISEKRGVRLVIRPFYFRNGAVSHEFLYVISQLFVVVLIAIAFFVYINNVSTDVGFEKRYYAIDLGLVTTSLHSAAGILSHSYELSTRFDVPVDFVFDDWTVNVKERGSELNTKYWFLSDINIDTLFETFSVPLREEGASKDNITFYKSSGGISFNTDNLNALEMVCPVINTSLDQWYPQDVFIGKVLPNAQDYSNENLPINRIVQVLSTSYGFQTINSGSGSSGSVLSAIPGSAKIVIIFGNSGDGLDAGSLVGFISVGANSLKERKLACFLINDILTPETVVFYSQIRPVYVDNLPVDSPLRVFKEKSSPDQLFVFLDIAHFREDQVDIENFGIAIKRALDRFFGNYDVASVSGMTLSYTSVSSSSVSTQQNLPVQRSIVQSSANGWIISETPVSSAVNGVVSYPENTLHNTHSETLQTVSAGSFRSGRCRVGGRDNMPLCPGVDGGSARESGGNCVCDVYVGSRARSDAEFTAGFEEWKSAVPKPSTPPTFTKDNLVITYYDVPSGDAACNGLQPSDCNDISKCSTTCRWSGCCNYGSQVSCWKNFYCDVKMQGTGSFGGKYYSFSGGVLENGALGPEKILRHTAHQSIAVNPNVGQAGYIPWGSRVYIDFKADDAWDGWYIADDTGSAFRCCPKIDIFAGIRGSGHPNSGRGYDIWVFPPIRVSDSGDLAVV